ncbi:unnamed protein product [Lactuca saligna]|uniref:Uncharacterized protein n=1 Tax=Lactuca saligna TaxID=75948 RepID=A0AA36EPD4_LACSI|nr:unnamed protein product [Lactuca saligna]
MEFMAQVTFPLNVIYPDALYEVKIPQDSSSLAPPLPKKKSKLTANLEELAKEWRLPIEEVREMILEYNTLVQEEREEYCYTKLAQMYASPDGSLNVQRANFQRFNNIISKQKRVSELHYRINGKKFGDVLAQSSKPNSIIIVRWTKPKDESLKVHMVGKKTEY